MAPSGRIAPQQCRQNAALARPSSESETAKLEEAVAAHRDALKEITRERVPVQWATSIGSEGVALMLLAERRGNAVMAKTALSDQ